MYLESNINDIYHLLNVEKNTINQYFTYQIFSKKLIIEFADTSSGSTRIKEKLITEDYNSMFHYNINYESQGSFRILGKIVRFFSERNFQGRSWLWEY